MAETLIVVLVLGLLALPVWVITKLLSLSRENNAIAQQLQHLQQELQQLKHASRTEPTRATAPTPAPVPAAPLSTVPLPPPAAPAPAERVPVDLSHTVIPASVPAPAAVTPAMPPQLPPQTGTRAVQPPEPPAPKATPSAYEPGPQSSGDEPQRDDRGFNWEQFMGAKLFAWLGGFAAFLGAAFFVKYSFEHDWIPPEVRVAIGFLFALGMIVGGLRIPRERYAITAQTLIATGVVSLYAVTFACNSYYHFAFFGTGATFALMSLITATAFLLAVRLDARVVAILGMLGGFLTPVLLSTGKDNPGGLFGYLALLNIGLIAVALHRQWFVLVTLGAVGTVAMQIGWAAKFFTEAKAPILVTICLSYCALFLGAYLAARHLARRRSESPDAALPVSPYVTWSAALMAFTALGFAFSFLTSPALAARPGLVLGFAFAADLFLLALAWLDEDLPQLHLASGAVLFALLAAWTGSALVPSLLPWGLAFYLAYAALHSAFPLLLERHRPDAEASRWSQLFPPLTLVLMLLPVLRFEELSLALWPCILLVDVIAIGVALATGSVVVVGAVLLLTLGATGAWLFNVPATSAAVPELLIVIGAFALFFFGGALFLARRLFSPARSEQGGLRSWLADPRAQLPSLSALLPFILLVMVTQRVPLAHPSPVFGLALLLVILTLGLAAVLRLPWLPACALAGVAAVEYAWQGRYFSTASAGIPLAWFVLFYAVFTAFPFALRRGFTAVTGPWATSAIAGVVQFPLVYQLVRKTWPNDVPGLIPAAFSVVPLIALWSLARNADAPARTRMNQLAWFGGVALLFITLIFPIQFERQWITVAWVLEGAALLWLYHRVPHVGLRATGYVLLILGFIRLALNPAVLEYHARSATPILNWYLYSYGIAAIAMFLGARLLAPPRDRVLRTNAPAVLNTLGTVLVFLLVNIEIADFFSEPGKAVLTFQFTGNFARDMTYTIAWALFALILLLVSMARRLRNGRYAALALLGVVLLKLFLHDLARLHSLYRIGALFAVAVIAIIASFAYQRFLPSDEKKPDDR